MDGWLLVTSWKDIPYIRSDFRPSFQILDPCQINIHPGWEINLRLSPNRLYCINYSPNDLEPNEIPLGPRSIGKYDQTPINSTKNQALTLLCSVHTYLWHIYNICSSISLSKTSEYSGTIIIVLSANTVQWTCKMGPLIERPLCREKYIFKMKLNIYILNYINIYIYIYLLNYAKYICLYEYKLYNSIIIFY